MIRQQLLRVTETKCNLCHQWSMGNPKAGALFCCDACFARCQSGSLELTTPAGDSFRILLLKQDSLNSGKKKAQTLEELMSQDYQDSALKWSRVCSLIGQNEFSPEELELIGTQLQQMSRDHQEDTEMFLERLKTINCRLSTTFSDRSNPSVGQQDSKRFSNDFTATKSLQTSQKTKKPVLDDICTSLGQTRHARGYQFYFDQQDLQRHYQQKASPTNIHNKSKERQFGTELSVSSNQQQFFLSRRKSYNTSKRELRSVWEQPSKQDKLTDEEIKSRLGYYLEPRYPSTSLYRLMLAFIREAYARTCIHNHMAELINFKITSMDLLGWLHLIDFEAISTIKLVNSGLTDGQLSTLLDFITDKKVERLVLTGNKLSDSVVPLFLNRPLPHLRELYLAKNRINGYRMRENIAEMRVRFVLYL